MRNTGHNIRHEMASRLTLIALAIGIFVVLSGILHALDLVPVPLGTLATSTHNTATSSTEAGARSDDTEVDVATVPESPVVTRIIVPSVEIDTAVVTPASDDVTVLDRALLSGAVHYPGSGVPGKEGNMLIFGHSSYLPVVRNKAFQAFNDLGKLEEGAVVTVLTDSHRYTYRIKSVRLTRAEDAIVPLDVREPTITLATCNTFGAKEDRYVAEGTLISTEVLSSS